MSNKTTNFVKYKLLKSLSIFLSWILSVFGISVGHFGCAVYGPPDEYESYKQLNDLQHEVFKLQNDLEKEKNEIKKIKIKIEDAKRKNKTLEAEKDSINSLLQEFNN